MSMQDHGTPTKKREKPPSGVDEDALSSQFSSVKIDGEHERSNCDDWTEV
jgi:hypothetical protein